MTLKTFLSHIKATPTKKIIHSNYIWLFPLLFLLNFLMIQQIDSSYKRQIEETVLPSYISEIQLSSYPFLREVWEPVISAEAAIIMHEPSRTILYAKNPDIRFSMASTTKIMTALVALEQYNLQDVLTVNTAGVGGAVVGFSNGEKLTFENILYGLLLPSGNDAAYTLARNYPGGVSNFVKKMNEKALSLGLKNTQYAEPAGLNDDYGFTTPSDLARLSAYALQNPTMQKIVSTQFYTISTVGNGKTYQLQNINKLLGLPGVKGMKTGFTERAGEVLVTVKEENGETYIFVVMKSKDRFSDTKILFFLLENNIEYFNPAQQISHLN